MNLVGAFTSHRSKSGTPYGGGYTGYSAPFADAYNRTRAPNALELIRENLGTAYACAMLNADMIASTPLRLYLKTRRGEGKSGISRRGDTRRLSQKQLVRLERTASKSVADASDVEEVTYHPSLELIAKPNRINEDGVGMSGFSLFNIIQQYLDIVGRTYWYIEKNGIGKTPSAIWVLAPQRTSEIPSYADDGKIIDYYNFSGGVNGLTRYETDEIVPFRTTDLSNVYTGGTSALGAVFEQVRLSRKVDAQTNAILDTGAKPSAIWSPAAQGEAGGFIGKDEAERMRRALRQAFAQAGAGGVMVSETAGALSILNWPMKDIIDASRIELSTDVICAAFQVPTTKFKRNDSNRASAQTGDYAHAKDAGLPRLRRLEAALNSFFLPMYGDEAAQRLFFAFDDPPGLHDDAAEKEEFDQAAARGSVTRNEERSRLGLADEPWGDQPLVLNTMIAVDQKTGLPQRPAPSLSPDTTNSVMNDLSKSVRRLQFLMEFYPDKLINHERASQNNGDSPNGEDGSGDPTMDNRGCASVRARGNGRHAAGYANSLRNSGGEGEARNSAGVDTGRSKATINTTANGLARTLPDGAGIKSVMLKVFHEQRQAVLEQIEGRYGEIATNPLDKSASVKAGEDDGRDSQSEIPKQFIPLDQWNDKIARESQPVIEVIMGQQGRALLTRVGASPDVFSVFEKNIPKAAEQMALKFSKETTDTTSMQLEDALTRLRSEISDGLVEGDTRVELTKRVNAIFDQADTSRAETIARTEASRATHTGELMSAKDSGVVSKKFWLLSDDACPVCDEIAASTPDGVGLNDEFAPGIDAPPDSHPNCQCSLAYSVADDGSR